MSHHILARRDIVRTSYSNAEVLSKYAARANEGLRLWEEAVLESHFPDSGRILVVGCGAGRESFALEERGYEIVGVDISEVMVSKAREIAADRNSSAEFQTGDGRRLAFENGTFDAVTLWNQMLGNLPGEANRGGLLSECRRVLRSGGVLALSGHDGERTVPLLRDGWVVVDGYEDLEDGDLMLEDEGSVRYWHYFSRPELAHLCDQAGLVEATICHTSDLGQSWGNVFIVVAQAP